MFVVLFGVVVVVFVVSSSVDARWGCAGAGVRECGCGCWRGCGYACFLFLQKFQKFKKYGTRTFRGAQFLVFSFLFLVFSFPKNSKPKT